jgi:hypothetical protein
MRLLAPHFGTVALAVLLLGVTTGCEGLSDRLPLPELFTGSGYVATNGKVQFDVPADYDPGDSKDPNKQQKAVVLVDGAGVTYHSFVRDKFAAALQGIGMRVNDHAAAETLQRLLGEIGANSEDFATRLDQLGVDTVLILEVSDVRLTHRNHSGQTQYPYNAEFVMTLRSVSPRSSERTFGGSARLSGSVRDEATASSQTYDFIELVSQQLVTEMVPAETPST